MATNEYSFKGAINNFIYALAPAGAIILAAIIGLVIGKKIEHFAEWVPFFTVGFTLAILILSSYIAIPLKFKQSCLLLGWLFIGLLPYGVYKIFQQFHDTIGHGEKLGMDSLILIAAVIVNYRLGASHFMREISQGKRILIYASLLLLTLLAWGGLFQLTNWGTYIKTFAISKLHFYSAFIICFCIAFAYTFNLKKNHLPRSVKIILNSLLALIFLIMSFRYDTLSLVGASFQLHWEYFVGPIRGLRDGGWLLWDIPSQYGFLNIFLASLLPVKSSWQAMYTFQGILLFIAALLAYRVISDSNRNLGRILIAALMTFCAVFFADPELIGPYPYPSSSVVRFFWCYVFIYLLYKYSRDDSFSAKKFLYYGTICWMFSVLWSAESAIYTTVTFYSALFIITLQKLLDKNNHSCRFQLGSFYLLQPIAAMLVVLILISSYYYLQLQHFPDWSMFFMYGLGYAAGFGSFPLSLVGSIWLLISLLIVIVCQIKDLQHSSHSERAVVALVGAAGCLWAISSYYVGRAVPQNITAMLPVITTLTALALNISQKKMVDNAGSYFLNLPIKSVALILMFLIMITVIGNSNFLERIKPFKSFNADMSQLLLPAKSSLQKLTTKLAVPVDDRIAYYGSSAFLPRLKTAGEYTLHDSTWLPAPMQLLELPISHDKKELIVKRFLSRSLKAGYLIHAKGEGALEEASFANWVMVLKQYYSETKLANTQKWYIAHFEPKSQD